MSCNAWFVIVQAGSPVIRVLHISDIHLDPLYQEGASSDCGEPLCCRKTDPQAEPGNGAGKYGDYACDTPLITLENMLKHINDTQEFDYALWTGDIPAHNVWNQSRADQLQALDYAVKLILEYLPNKVIIQLCKKKLLLRRRINVRNVNFYSLWRLVKKFKYSLKHERERFISFPPPSITGPDSNQWLRDSLASHWHHWLPDYTMSTIKKGAYYTVLISKGLRIISLNMNYCNNMNWWLLLNDVDPAHQLQWLVDTLQEAEDNGEKVHIIGHIPPGSGDCLRAWSWNYYSIINRYQSTVTAQFFGHTHNDEFEIFYDEETSKIPLSIAYIGPSVTPFQGHNPGYRIYTVDGNYANSSRVVLDHETYILDLEKANKGNVTWELEYKAKEAYKMKSLLPAEWDNLVNRMATDKDLLEMVYK
ncbi:Sphingomyelin phosphodiesterase [Exaiptasia diaphana]|nr:Sphingomyelin phosphodiesterase [Exaiptasia diaphana]